MTNGEVYVSLAEALRRKFQEEDKSLEDIDFIAVDGYGLNTKDFLVRAEQVPWNINQLKDGFRVVFKDHTWISKHYNKEGKPRLKYHKAPERPVCIIGHPKPQEFMNIKEIVADVIDATVLKTFELTGEE